MSSLEFLISQSNLFTFLAATIAQLCSPLLFQSFGPFGSCVLALPSPVTSFTPFPSQVRRKQWLSTRHCSDGWFWHLDEIKSNSSKPGVSPEAHNFSH
jgi:hypothetical protein